MNSKSHSVFIIFLIYIVGLFIGVLGSLLSKCLYENVILALLVGDICFTIVVYIFSVCLRNSSIYDPYWSVAVPFILLGYLYYCQVKLNLYIVLIYLAMLTWSIRLTLNWLKGFKGLHFEDFRYRLYRKKKCFQLINFFGIMLVPTILVFLGCLPFYYYINNEISMITTILSCVIILIGVCFQFISDNQMRAFKKDENKKSNCIDRGLWRYSRHPNYFGEIVVWFGLATATFNRFNIFNVIGVILIILLFLFISIPLMENHLLKYKEEYSEYKKKVISPLVPFKRSKK